jgi:ABC-2 type transport system ATP-binding protein
MANPAIVVEHLEKRYGENRAVDGVSFAVEEGEVFALLGPNGAGKTTTLEILEGHRHRDGGEVAVLGYDPGNGGRGFRERIGIVLQSSALERELEIHEAVAFYAEMFPHPRPVDTVIDIVGLTGKADARIKLIFPDAEVMIHQDPAGLVEDHPHFL